MSTEYSMIFGQEFSDIKNLRYNEIGSGLIMRSGEDSRPREFVAPYIKNGEVRTPPIWYLPGFNALSAERLSHETASRLKKCLRNTKNRIVCEAHSLQ